jgi:hypothetical protein
MQIIGVDLHTRQQTVAMLNVETGEIVEKTLQYEGDSVREFYSTTLSQRINLIDNINVCDSIRSSVCISGTLIPTSSITRVAEGPARATTFRLHCTASARQASPAVLLI